MQIISSIIRVFPGLWLDLPALRAAEITKVLAVLQQGLNSEEHPDFVQRLARTVVLN